MAQSNEAVRLIISSDELSYEGIFTHVTCKGTSSLYIRKR